MKVDLRGLLAYGTQARALARTGRKIGVCKA